MSKENNDSNHSEKPEKPISHADIPKPQSVHIQNGRNMDGVIRRKSKE